MSVKSSASKGLLKEESKFKYTLHQMRINASAYGMIAPFFILFTIFTIIPVTMSLPIGFTNFNLVQFPKFVGLSNFYTLFLEDDTFLIAIKNTLIFAVLTGPLSYLACFLIAWLINNLGRTLKTVFTVIFYAPSMATNIYVIWQLIFSGDTYGFANAWLIKLGITNGAIQWLTDTKYMMGVVILVQMWISLGAGFLAMIAGLQGIPRDRYEAGSIEGIRNRAQELVYITIPAMGPQMLFAAVMQITSSFTAGQVGQMLTGFPSTDYATHTIQNHAFDYGFIRYEMGYASAVLFVLFMAMILTNNIIRRVLRKYTEV